MILPILFTKMFIYFKFKNTISLQKCVFMLQIRQNQKSGSFSPGFKLCVDKHNYMIRSGRQGFSNVHFSKTYMYEVKSVKYNCLWWEQLQEKPSKLWARINNKFYANQVSQGSYIRIVLGKNTLSNRVSFQPFV